MYTVSFMFTWSSKETKWKLRDTYFSDKNIEKASSDLCEDRGVSALQRSFAGEAGSNILQWDRYLTLRLGCVIMVFSGHWFVKRYLLTLLSSMYGVCPIKILTVTKKTYISIRILINAKAKERSFRKQIDVCKRWAVRDGRNG